jgi:hypothetical protein
VFPEDVVRDGISARYLLEHDDQVVATVPALGTLGPGDSVTWYWEEDAEGNRPLGTDTLSQDDIGKPLTVVFKGDDLRRLNNGSRVATYRLHDRAGNPTELSALVRLNVDIAPPAPRQRPSVLEADASGGTFTLNPRKALAGATVQVPGLADDRPGDGIRVYWKGDNAYDSVEVGEGHDLKFAVAPGVVAASMGTSIQVFYDVTWPGFDPDRSGIVALAVDALPQNAYTTISCDEATVNPVTLSLANALEGARLTLDPWVFKPFAAGQCLTVNVTGIGLEAPVTIADAMPVEADRQKVYVHLPRELLLRITVGTQFRIHPKASFNGAASFHPFPELDIRLVP